jgi:DNA-binding transcriptional regulator YiaG
VGGYLVLFDNTRAGEPLNWRALDLGTSAYKVSLEDVESSSALTLSAPKAPHPSEKALQGREATRREVMELRRLSGLTWDQLAHLFGVSRRSLHFWASGKPLSAQNEERLHRTLALLKHVDRGNADENRQLLLTPIDNRETPLELLAKGEFEAILEALGPGSGTRAPSRTPLSASAWEARLPPKPEQLVDALQDSIHRDPSDVRVARTKRTKG